MMSRSNSDNRKLFYVVQFIELPFENIDKYVCVPHSWILRMTSGEKVAVAYPNNEDRLTIRDRVKNKEKPNDKWRFYIAAIKYESHSLEDADNWTETQNDNKLCERETSGKYIRVTDSQPEPKLNRKLRSASHPFFSGTKYYKPSVSVKPYKNPRKPLPRISIRLPLQSKLKKYMDTKRVKLDEIAHSVSGDINHSRAVSEHLKKKQSIIIRDNRLIQNAQTGIAAAFDDKTNSKHTLPDFNKRDKSIMSEQSALPKLPHKNQPSLAGQIDEQALSRTYIDCGFDEHNHEDDVADHVKFETLKKDAIIPGKTPTNSGEQVPQSESVSERSTPLVHHKHSLPERRLQDVPATLSKKAHVNPRTQLLQILTTPVTVPRPSSIPNQLSQSKSLQAALLQSSSAIHQNPQLQGTNRGSSTEVIHNHQRPLGVTRQEPSSSTAQFHLLGNSVVKPAPQLTRKPLEEAFQQPISNARSDLGIDDINLSAFQQRMNTSTVPNFPNAAEYFRFLAEQSQDQQYQAMQQYYLQHMARLSKPNNGQSIDRGAHQPVIMNREFDCQAKQNSIGQPKQLFPQFNNQYVLLSGDYMRGTLRHGGTSLRESIDRAHLNSQPTQNIERNFQFCALNLPNQLNCKYEHPKKIQEPPRYQNLSGHYPKFRADPQETERRRFTVRTQPPALPKSPSQPLLNAQRSYLHRDPRTRAKLKKNPTEHQILDPVVSRNLVDEVKPTTVNAEVQTGPLHDRLDETPSALLLGIGIAYQNPRTKKLVVDQATEIDPVLEADHCQDQVESSDKSDPQVADSGCQTDGYSVKEQNSMYQETDSESEKSTHDVVLDRDGCEDHSRVNTVGEIKPTSSQNPEMQQRLATEEEILNMCDTLFTQMSPSLHSIRDLFDHVQKKIIKCDKVYESLLEKIKKIQ